MTDDNPKATLSVGDEELIVESIGIETADIETTSDGVARTQADDLAFTMDGDRTYEGQITIEREFDTLAEYNKHIDKMARLFGCGTITDEEGRKRLIQFEVNRDD
ncbi:hypothetical protein [Halococcus saccharolyticus]|uniref:Uncharacterized protein n=1 Tax=Halococcus saccharolyticus DSM 5350 TaxID=1227455 RepID=M0MPQ1_9EURY|nr:hypothetical protein [Halococcus saccharolyticus]EMA47616.1 hypothetical protein C449_01097 [Halococcus saccharolyticus DSM 5350]